MPALGNNINLGNLKMNAYLIIDLTIHDFSKFSEYINKIPEFIKKHSGKYIVQGEEATVMEGNWNPERMIVIEFSSRENANNFLQDKEAQTLFALRHETTTSNVILVDGC